MTNKDDLLGSLRPTKVDIFIVKDQMFVLILSPLPDHMNFVCFMYVLGGKFLYNFAKWAWEKGELFNE